MTIYKGEGVDSGWTGDITKRVDNEITYTIRKMDDHSESHCEYDDSVTVWAIDLPGMPSPLEVALINRSGNDRNLYGYKLKAGMAAFMACFTKDMLHYLVTPVDIDLGNRVGFLEAIRLSSPTEILCKDSLSNLFARPLVPAGDGSDAFEFIEVPGTGLPGDLDLFETTYRIAATTTVNASFPTVARFRTGSKLKRRIPLDLDTEYQVHNNVVLAPTGEVIGGLVSRRFCPIEENGTILGPQIKASAAPRANDSSWRERVFGPKHSKFQMSEMFLPREDGLVKRGWCIRGDTNKKIPVGGVILDSTHLVDLDGGFVRNSGGSVVATFRTILSGAETVIADLEPSEGSPFANFVDSALARYLGITQAICLCYSGDEDHEFARALAVHMSFHFDSSVSVPFTYYSNLAGTSLEPGELLHGKVRPGAESSDLPSLAKSALTIFNLHSKESKIPADIQELAYWFSDINGREVFVVMMTS